MSVDETPGPQRAAPPRAGRQTTDGNLQRVPIGLQVVFSGILERQPSVHVARRISARVNLLGLDRRDKPGRCRSLSTLATTSTTRRRRARAQSASTRRHLHGRVLLARRRAADQQRRRDFGAPFPATSTISSSDGVIRPDTDDVGFPLTQNAVERHHHAEIDHVMVIYLRNDADNVLADVVNVAFDGGEKDQTVRLRPRFTTPAALAASAFRLP